MSSNSPWTFEDLCSPPASASSGYHFLTRCFSTALICAGINVSRRWRHGGYALRHDAVDGVRAAPNSRQWRTTLDIFRRTTEGKTRTPDKNGKVQFAHEVRRRDGIDIFTRHFEDGAVDTEIYRFLVFRIVLR